MSTALVNLTLHSLTDLYGGPSKLIKIVWFFYCRFLNYVFFFKNAPDLLFERARHRASSPSPLWISTRRSSIWFQHIERKGHNISKNLSQILHGAKIFTFWLFPAPFDHLLKIRSQRILPEVEITPCLCPWSCRGTRTLSWWLFFFGGVLEEKTQLLSNPDPETCCIPCIEWKRLNRRIWYTVFFVFGCSCRPFCVRIGKSRS